MLTVFVQIITIVSLIIFTGLSIAAFVILSKLFMQIKYKNYLLENLVQNVSLFVRQTYKTNNSMDNPIKTTVNDYKSSDNIEEEILNTTDNDINTSSCVEPDITDTLVSNTFSDELNELNNSSNYISD